MKNSYRYTIIDATQGWPIGCADSEREAIRIHDAAMERDSSRELAILNADGDDVTVDILFPQPETKQAYIYFVYDADEAALLDEGALDFILSTATFLDADEARTFAHTRADRTGRMFIVDECKLGENWLANCTERWEIRPYRKEA